jgi:hypothetical protein
MMKWFKNLGRAGRITVVSVFVFVLVVILLLSPIAEYIIEKNSREWTGRTITMEDLRISLLTGQVEAKGLVVYEPDDKAPFITCGNLLVNVTVYRMLTGFYHISEVNITNPTIQVIQDENGFNFDDLMAADTTLPADTTGAEPVKFRVDDIRVSGGAVDYKATYFNNAITFQQISLHVPRIGWDDQGMRADCAFTMGEGGSIRSDFEMDYASGQYTATIQADTLNLGRLKPYMDPYIRLGKFACSLSCGLRVYGNSNEATDIALAGTLSLDRLLFTAPQGDTLFSLRRIALDVDTVNMKHNIFRFGSIALEQPEVLYELYDNGTDNITSLLVTDSTTADSSTTSAESANPFLMMSDFAKEISGAYDMNTYRVDSFVLSDGRVVFKDFSLLETFAYYLTDIRIFSNTLNSDNNQVRIDMQSKLNYTGDFEARLNYDPKNYRDMDLYYRINGVRLSDMSPYAHFYVAHPFWDGIVQFESNNSVRGMKLISKNDLRMVRVEVGDKAGHQPLFELPLKLALSLLKDLKGDIKLNIPIEGDLADPEYKLGKVIWQVVKNILLKAVTSPYRLLADVFSVNEDDIRRIHFSYLDSTFADNQVKNLEVLAKILEKKPELRVSLAQYTDTDQEAERFAMISTMDRYRKVAGNLTPDDPMDTSSEKTLGSAFREAAFTAWLDIQVGPANALLPVQKKCLLLTGNESSRQEALRLQELRNAHIGHLLAATGADSTRIQVYTEKRELVPATEPLPCVHISFGAVENEKSTGNAQAVSGKVNAQ